MKNKTTILVFVLLILTFSLIGCLQAPEDVDTGEETETEDDMTIGIEVDGPGDEVVEEDMVPQDDLAMIIKMFSEEYDMPIATITLENVNNTETHMRGTVILDDNNPEETTSLFFAAKTDGEWDIVYVGDEPAPCADVEPYGFPSAMIEDCS